MPTEGVTDVLTGRAGLVRARKSDGDMEKLTHAVVDDVLYNIISDLVMATHRNEKTARASTAAIRVEKLAADASDNPALDSRPDVRVETDAAVYDDGKVLLKENPLVSTSDILCPKCHLPKLLYPTDGKGSRTPDPTVQYCKLQPYIEKPGCDIYGQSWVGPGPGRGKKKKDMEKKDDPPPDQRPPNVLSFPSATCSKCKRCILVTRLNNHMGSCIGNSGRNASRAAAQKLSNGNGNGSGSQNDPTPPSSQKATPAPGSRATSPRKREASEEGDESEGSQHKKKKVKSLSGSVVNGTNGSSAQTKKVIIKTKPNLKKDKTKGPSLLSQEQTNGSDDSDSPQKKSLTNKASSPIKKLKAVKPPHTSPLSKNGRDAGDDSDDSAAASSPPGSQV